ncbi:MAG: transporter substrate-binding domain-containing protein [bacterium]|nr:transporter substrate-binding domain-containing protein [bacterium]
MRKSKLSIIFIVVLFFVTTPIWAQTKDFLSPEETLWLESRNNTIVVFPEKNFPPYSYQNTSGAPQGLSIDYIELIAKKIGFKIQYLPARPLYQVLEEVKQNQKGDIIPSVTYTKEHEEFLYFSDDYIIVPAVIVVRKDSDIRGNITINDLSGKKVAIGNKFAVEEFVRTNNPRIIIESMVDDESGLQQVVLGEVEAAIMDIASLSHYLFKNVLSSVRVVGNTGFEYKFAFGIPKDKAILQSIIDKGLMQISATDRKILADKWITISVQDAKPESMVAKLQNNIGLDGLYILLGLCIIAVALILTRRRHFPAPYSRKTYGTDDLKEEVFELERMNEALSEELKEVKVAENKIQKKLESLDK